MTHTNFTHTAHPFAMHTTQKTGQTRGFFFLVVTILLPVGLVAAVLAITALFALPILLIFGA